MAGKTVLIGEDDDGRRLDRILRKYLPGIPLSALHRLLRKGSVKLDGKKAEASDRPRAGAELTLPVLETGTRQAEAMDGSACARPDRGEQAGTARLDPSSIVFENEHLIIINKEAGVLTHGEGGLDLAVSDYLEPSRKPSLSFRSGPLHRLDRGTSGLVAFSKDLEGARRFSSAIAERRVGKRYLAVLCGVLSEHERWEDSLERNERTKTSAVSRTEGNGSRAACTEVSPLASDGKTTLALIELGTGRTHQIRVQAAARGRSLLGDRKYGGAACEGGFFLHAYELSDESDPPQKDLIPAVLTAPPPARFIDFVRKSYGPAWAERIFAGLPSARLLDAIM